MPGVWALWNQSLIKKIPHRLDYRQFNRSFSQLRLFSSLMTLTCVTSWKKKSAWWPRAKNILLMDERANDVECICVLLFSCCDKTPRPRQLRKVFNWDYGFRGLGPMIARWRNIWELTSWSISTRPRGGSWGTGNRTRLWKPQSMLLLTCLFHKGHVPPNCFQTVHQLESKYSNVWVYGGHCHSNYDMFACCFSGFHQLNLTHSFVP